MSETVRLEPPIGQGAAFERLLRNARQLRMHHALVIAGPPGSGKSTIARWIAAALLCPSELDRDGPCGVCRVCRRIASQQFPDLHVLTRDDERREIRVDQVRELQDALLRLPVEGRARVALIDPGDELNRNGQNTLLKTLEEPGADTFLLLTTSRPEALLPTVRSRCERYAVRGLDAATLRRELQRRVPQNSAGADRAIALADGSLGAALDASTERTVQLHDLVLALCNDNKPLRILAVARAVAAGATSEEKIAAARRFAALLRREAALAARRALAAAGEGFYVAGASEPWTTVVELTLVLERDLEAKIPPEQAVAGLLLEWDLRRGSRATSP